MATSSQKLSKKSADNVNRWPNPCEKLLRRFYEPLVLLSILRPTQRDTASEPTVSSSLSSRSKLWHDFLDALSWICDSEKGGDTVSSVAAQRTDEGPILWLTSNEYSGHRTVRHLESILATLKPLCASPGARNITVETAMTATCIDFSIARVRVYARWLKKAIEEVQVELSRTENMKDRILRRVFVQIESKVNDPHDLCTFAFVIRRSEAMAILDERKDTQGPFCLWSDIRHYIGRLGSWRKAVQILLLGVEQFPQHIETARIEVIEPCHQGASPIQLATNFKDLVRRLLPATESLSLEEMVQSIADIDRVLNIEAKFREKCEKINPRPHAELVLLEHFYQRGFEFVDGDNYIGCSKPSCYCCNIYMRCHPGNFVPRACHGNLWANWAPPVPLPSVKRSKSVKTSTEPARHHTFQMLQTMLGQIRKDLHHEVLVKQPKRTRMIDSTSGLSSIPRDIALMSTVAGSDVALSSSSSVAGDSSEPSNTEVENGEEDEMISEFGDGDIVDEDVVLFRGRLSLR